MFKVGEKIVYKKDVCSIKEIKVKDDITYYSLTPLDDESLKIIVPINNEYLRNVISREKAESIISDIPNVDIIDCDDRMIENEYKKLLYTGDHEDLIKVIKTTYLRNDIREKNGKKIGDKDKDYFDKAERYLYNELSLALDISFDECKEYIAKKVKELGG